MSRETKQGPEFELSCWFKFVQIKLFDIEGKPTRINKGEQSDKREWLSENTCKRAPRMNSYEDETEFEQIQLDNMSAKELNNSMLKQLRALYFHCFYSHFHCPVVRISSLSNLLSMTQKCVLMGLKNFALCNA